ncbi:hypothetical protein JRO89_XS04G0172300 [Xanthoceras sorbifolium]|uniref:Protein kinase domain-containing protein n=1 Tax=Xanthoceras sorbifolium TaxID=99658 RepID=A0ABQ8I5N9_9ROSI|nr:hypothetical protein JRO89_XS04G0172300 [Xanthoceras sorbifolium]
MTLSTFWQTTGLLLPLFATGLGLHCDSQNNRVIVLNLTSMSLTGTIPPHIGNLSFLVQLRLRNNSFQGSIPVDLVHLHRLEILHLGYNSFQGEIPSWLGSLPKLQILYLFRNNFTGTIPPSLGNITTLKNLELWNNNLQGNIPEEIGNLNNLETFNLYGNQQISGTIPPTIFNISSLDTIDFALNRLSGNLPDDMCQYLRVLKRLILHHNQLEGSIPSSLGQCKELLRISLDGNKFTGIIPRNIGNLSLLQELYLDTNDLKGELPEELGSLHALERLRAGKSRITGSIPPEIGNLHNLKVLSLHNNSLTSLIPSTIFNISKLESIGLYMNRLSGPLPSTIGLGLPNLKELLLWDNELNGIIPGSISNASELTILELALNLFSGPIPTALGPFTNFSAESFMGNSELCGASRLQVPQCKTHALQELKKKKASVMKPIYILPTIASMILVLAFTYFLLRSRKRKSKSLEEEDVLTLATWRRISYQELQNATNGYEESNLLGTGGFGSVYRGKFLDGMIIAVKVFNLQVDRASKSFDDECEVMSKIRHRNLVKIISSCSNIDFKALVLEYMPNGSLETWLYSHNYCLDTLQRLNIMIDVASALEYLHHDYATPIVHCDLKPSNVLLDKDMVAHIGDFGIAKLLGEGDSMRQTNTLATIGYMAPEYGSEGIVSVTGDVYSFGILMMETFTRKKPTDNMFEGGMSLKWWVKEALPDSVTEIADANLLGEENLSAKVDCISSTLQLAVSCSEELSERRMDITNVLGKLQKIRKEFEKSVVLP